MLEDAEQPPLPLVVRAVASLLIFGAFASGASFIALLFPDSALRSIWRLNPQAEPQLLGLGVAGIVLMGSVCLACSISSVGLLRRRWWGYRLALGILIVNVIADAATAFVRDDMRTLIGVPIGGLLIFFLLRPRVVALYRFER